MGSSPIIISDDGSPPPGVGIFVAAPKSGMRVSREVNMDTLMPGGTLYHDVKSPAISSVVVIINGASHTPATNVNRVEVSGGNTHIKVEISDDIVRVSTDHGLAADHHSTWYRYLAGAASIDTVKINGKTRLQNCGN